ncbi:MAG TPA: hypothetical protein VF516_21800, partial [Kofleriaceae bacterium]
ARGRWIGPLPMRYHGTRAPLGWTWSDPAARFTRIHTLADGTGGEPVERWATAHGAAMVDVIATGLDDGCAGANSTRRWRRSRPGRQWLALSTEERLRVLRITYYENMRQFFRGFGKAAKDAERSAERALRRVPGGAAAVEARDGHGAEYRAVPIGSNYPEATDGWPINATPEPEHERGRRGGEHGSPDTRRRVR